MCERVRRGTERECCHVFIIPALLVVVTGAGMPLKLTTGRVADEIDEGDVTLAAVAVVDETDNTIRMRLLTVSEIYRFPEVSMARS